MAASSALDRVLDQATAASDSFAAGPAASAGELVVKNDNGGALAKPSMSSFVESGGITVDEYLRMDKAGFQIGDMKKYFDSFVVELDMSAVVPIYQSRGEAGGKTTFIKSYDGVTTSQGQNFQAAVAHLQATTKCTGIYPTAEIPVELLDELVVDDVTVAAGAKIGITPSLTGWKEFQSFVKGLSKQGLEDATLKVKVVHKMRTNTNNNKWGVATFELIEKIRD